MFDRYMIVESGFRNQREDGQVRGFEFGARLPYYRGLGLSMVEDIQVKVDGQPVPRERLRFVLRGRRYTLEEMERTYDAVWEMGEVARIEVVQPGGLPSGPHTIELTEMLRVSYMPFPIAGRDTKTLAIAD